MERRRAAAIQKIDRLRARMRAHRRERERTYDIRHDAMQERLAASQARLAAQLEEINQLVSVLLHY